MEGSLFGAVSAPACWRNTFIATSHPGSLPENTPPVVFILLSGEKPSVAGGPRLRHLEALTRAKAAAVIHGWVELSCPDTDALPCGRTGVLVGLTDGGVEPRPPGRITS